MTKTPVAEGDGVGARHGNGGRVGGVAPPLRPQRHLACQDEPHPRARLSGDEVQLVPLRTIHHDRTTGRWQTLALLVGAHLPFDLPHVGQNGYLALTRDQAERLRDVLEFDGHLLPPLSDADRATVEELREVLRVAQGRRRKFVGRSRW